jgi:hypothetical protein
MHKDRQTKMQESSIHLPLGFFNNEYCHLITGNKKKKKKKKKKQYVLLLS